MECPTCNGTGDVWDWSKVEPNQRCRDCDGTGITVAVCRSCGNTGWAELDNAYCPCPYGQARSLDDEKAQERRWSTER